MLIFLHGTDHYRLKQACGDFINRYKAKYSSGINLFTFNFGDDIGEDDLVGAVKSSSFFNEHKLIICKNIFGNKSATDTLATLIKGYSLQTDSSVTLLAIERLSEKEMSFKNKELLNLLLQKPNVVKHIDLLEGSKLLEWAKGELGIRGCSMDHNSLNKLIDLVGNDSWALVNEIEKLTSYKNGGVISGTDIASLVSPKVDPNIFDLIDAISSKDSSRGIELLYREIKSGRDPYYILTMIIYQFRNLLMIGGLSEEGFSQAEISKKAKIHPFVVRKAMANLSRFKKEDLLGVYRRLLSIDVDFKTGRANVVDSISQLL